MLEIMEAIMKRDFMGVWRLMRGHEITVKITFNDAGFAFHILEVKKMGEQHGNRKQ